MKPPGSCMWFAKCTNKATTTEPHSLLKQVPICESCQAKLRRLEKIDLCLPDDAKVTTS